MSILTSHLNSSFCFFFFNDTATTEIYTRKDTLSLHDALPILYTPDGRRDTGSDGTNNPSRSEEHTSELQSPFLISYAVFCLKKKKNKITTNRGLYNMTHAGTPSY